MYQLNQIWEAIVVISYYPLDILAAILTNVSREYTYVARVFSAGKGLNPAMIWDLLKWGLLFMLIISAALYLCLDTLRRVLSSERQKKNFLIDAVMIALTLLVYYALVSIGLYVFFNVVVPIALEL